MKKETTAAIVLGFFLGGIVALSFILSTKEKEVKTKKVIPPKLTPTIKITPQKINLLEITKPSPNFITDKNRITLKGKTEKNSLIIIQSPTSEKAIKTKANNFSVEFPLSLGENLIKVTSYHKNNSEQKTIKVYYLKQ